ncbi:SubName: Full=Uncharacterized protein {ECO:0000313/EMBL:CCA72510.1} [Serendipita indica DSM 11827]|nr:SubName: Full=Uncharacterized protein {ECO:0000313/EMBL:CCA72510.1} [Serendipita indica DSM 11827]
MLLVFCVDTIPTPGEQHWNAAKHVLRYLKGSQDLKLIYSPTSSTDLFTAHSDADLSGNPDNSRSTGGYVLSVGSGAVMWESEYNSICCGMRDNVDAPVSKRSAMTSLYHPLYLDSASAIQVVKNPEHQTTMKHVHRAYNWIREHVENKELRVQHVPTSENVADIFTKPLGRIKFEYLRAHYISTGLTTTLTCLSILCSTLGSAISHALIRNGHIVVGVTRNAEQARKLLAEEVIPAVGDPFAAETFSAHLADADVVIDVASGDMLHDGPRRFALIESLVVDPSIRAAPSTGVPKIAYFYTSGTWVHGDNRSVLRSDNAPLNPPMTSTRLSHGVQNLNKPSLTAASCAELSSGRAQSTDVRAGCTMLFSQAGSGKVEWFGVPGGTYATVHVDDLAECYLLAVEKNHLVSGLVIDVTMSAWNPSTDSLSSACESTRRAMSVTTKLRPTLARSLLGWEPRKASLTDGMAAHFEAWKAINASKSK